MSTAAKSSSAASKTSASTGPKSALTKLKSDHDAVKKLFDQYEKSKDKIADEKKLDLVVTICGELTVHTQIEEEIFYPAVREVATDELDEMLDEAEVEHAGAKDLIAQLADAQPSDPLYDAKVTVLGESVKHHAGEEEDEMFPKVKKTELDLEEIGAQLISRSNELKKDLGLK